MLGGSEVSKKLNDVRAEASSKSINKITCRIEEDFDLEAVGSKPSERFENVYSQMKEKYIDKDFLEEVDQLVELAYQRGVNQGFARALKRFMDGKILTKKIKNQNKWRLITFSKKFTVTGKVRSFVQDFKRVQTTIDLSEHGFR